MDYISNVKMTSDRYKDIIMITYAKYVAFLQVISVVFGLFYVYQVMYGKNYELLCINSGGLLAIAVVMFLSLKKNKVEQFENSFRQKDDTFVEYTTIFYDNKMEVQLSSGVNAVYSYSNVKAIKEAETLYFIEMPKDLHIVVDKNLKCNQKNNDFSKYIMEKCPKLREKRVINITKEKSVYIELIVLLGIAFVAAVVMNFVM